MNNEIYSSEVPINITDCPIPSSPGRNYVYDFYTSEWAFDSENIKKQLVSELTSIINTHNNLFLNKYSDIEQTYWSKLEQEIVMFKDGSNIDDLPILKMFYASDNDISLDEFVSKVTTKIENYNMFKQSIMKIQFTLDKDIRNITSDDDVSAVSERLTELATGTVEQFLEPETETVEE